MRWRQRSEHGRHAIARGLAAAVAGATIMAVDAPSPPATAAPGHRTAPPADRPTELQAWVVDGRLAALRRSALPPRGYGGQGVDYAPATWPVVSR